MTRFFGFTQLDLGGTLALADGRYVLRDGERERVLVLETFGAPQPARRRRRRARNVESSGEPTEVPVARVTVVRAFEPFDEEAAANDWLTGASNDEKAVDALVGEAVAALNRALHAQTVASGDPHSQAVAATRAMAVRIGYGSGEEVADGIFSAAREVDASAGASPRRRREQELGPQQRVAAVLGGKEQLDACETLLLRARADLDAGRNREAALQLRVGLEALLVELRDAVSDPDHDADMTTLEARRHEAGDLANAALQGRLSEEQTETLSELLATSERVLRRRRVLGG